MPMIGPIELMIMLFIVVILVIVVVTIVVAVRRPGRQGLVPAAAPPGWLTDPLQRHQYRYWDGAQWTGAVSDDGAQSSDPL
jgi:hypothetical protein